MEEEETKMNVNCHRKHSSRMDNTVGTIPFLNTKINLQIDVPEILIEEEVKDVDSMMDKMIMKS